LIGRLILGNYLAQYGKAAIGKLKAGFAISVPWNVFEATKSIEKPYLNLMLNKHLCSNLRRNVKHHFSGEKERLNLDLDTVLKVNQIKIFKFCYLYIQTKIKLLPYFNNLLLIY
jgi:abhydrolase domain-containing protein 1/3